RRACVAGMAADLGADSGGHQHDGVEAFGVFHRAAAELKDRARQRPILPRLQLGHDTELAAVASAVGGGDNEANRELPRFEVGGGGLSKVRNQIMVAAYTGNFEVALKDVHDQGLRVFWGRAALAMG